eukprot:3794502-Rhodomonas_salina.6
MSGSDNRSCRCQEKRVYFTEFMTGSRQSASDSVISAITLALLEDTGWYEVNYEAADQFKWGREQGCAFVSVLFPSSDRMLDFPYSVSRFGSRAVDLRPFETNSLALVPDRKAEP